jgi:hypothetical protein
VRAVPQEYLRTEGRRARPEEIVSRSRVSGLRRGEKRGEPDSARNRRADVLKSVTSAVIVADTAWLIRAVWPGPGLHLWVLTVTPTRGGTRWESISPLSRLSTETVSAL